MTPPVVTSKSTQSPTAQPQPTTRAVGQPRSRCIVSIPLPPTQAMAAHMRRHMEHTPCRFHHEFHSSRHRERALLLPRGRLLDITRPSPPPRTIVLYLLFLYREAAHYPRVISHHQTKDFRSVISLLHDPGHIGAIQPKKSIPCSSVFSVFNSSSSSTS